MGLWPPLIERPKIEYLVKKRRENFTQHQVRVEIAPEHPIRKYNNNFSNGEQQTVDGYLLVPDGTRLFPAMLVVYYDAKTS